MVRRLGVRSVILKRNTESRLSERGEQGHETVNFIQPADTPETENEKQLTWSQNTQEKEMRQTKLNETKAVVLEETFESNLETNNVLDFSSTLRELRNSVDPNLIRHRAARRDQNGNLHMVDYVEWHTVADILDRHAPNWAHTVKSIRPIGDIITVTVAITIDGVTREGIGTGRAISETGIKKAEHDALKRAAVKFGIARELYKKEFDSIEQEETAPVPAPIEKGDPVAKTLGDLVTTKQLGMIRAIAREINVDADNECSSVIGCKVAELSKRAASDFIEYLQSLQKKNGYAEAVPMRRAG